LCNIAYKFCRQEKIGYSIAGIEIPILKVSNPNQDYEVEKRIWQKQVRQRKKQAKENGEEPDLSDLPEPRRYPMKPVIVVIGR
jgi:hypothetical protein